MKKATKKTEAVLTHEQALQQKLADLPSFYTAGEVEAIKARSTIPSDLAKIRFEMIGSTFLAENSDLVLLCQEDNSVFYEYADGVYKERTHDDIQARLLKHFYKQEIYSYITAARVKDAFQRIQWMMRITPDKSFNRNAIGRNFINLSNGLFDINTKRFKEHTHKYFSTTQLPFKYNPEMQCPKFLKFVNEVSCNDPQIVAMIQELFGYCLTVGNPKHKIFFLYGKTGRNGKSTVAKLLQMLVGDRNTSALSLQQLSSDNSHLTVALANSQVNFSEEVSTKYIETTHLTNLTAEGIITVNPKNKPPYLMKVLTKFIVTCNDIPRFQSSQGMFKRQVIIPFNNSFEGRENTNIVLDLLEESSGIFNWALEGYDRIMSQGFTLSDASAIEMDEAKLDNNPVIEYIRTFFKFDSSNPTKYTAGQLYGIPRSSDNDATEYLGWCHLSGIPPMSKKKFAMELRRFADDARSIDVRRDAENIYYIGLARKQTLKQFKADMMRDGDMPDEPINGLMI